MRFIAGILIVLAVILLILIISQNRVGRNDEDLVLKFNGIEKKIPDLSIYGSTSITTKRGDTYLAFSVLELIAALEQQEEEFSNVIFHSSD